MRRFLLAKTCCCLLLAGFPWQGLAQEYRPLGFLKSSYFTGSKDIFQAPDGNGDEKKTNGNGKENGKDAPKHIRDNGFLVEEAFNQEPGEAQHIFNWIFLWDRTSLGRSRDFALTYTLELPLGTQKHQFSFTTQFLTSFDKPNAGPASQQGDIGDTFLNYRYQLLDDDEFLWCAPRFSLILPTADRQFGLGSGQLGYQFNLPVSRYGEKFDYHLNAGFTYIPNVSAPLDGQRFSNPHDLHGYNLGGSVYWKPKVNLHYFVESLALWNQAIDDQGVRGNITQVFINPGVRYAIVQDPVEWVVGVSVPVGLTRDSPDIGVFFYMSIEHSFRKVTSDK